MISAIYTAERVTKEEEESEEQWGLSLPKMPKLKLPKMPKIPKISLPKIPKIKLPSLGGLAAKAKAAAAKAAAAVAKKLAAAKAKAAAAAKGAKGKIAAASKKAAAALKKAGAAAKAAAKKAGGKVAAAAKAAGGKAAAAVAGAKKASGVAGAKAGAKALKPIVPAALDPAQLANDAKGKAFCSLNCTIDNKKTHKRCLVGTKLVKCKRCTGKPTNKDKKMSAVCAMVCNANMPASPCDFYGYSNNKKKIFNAGLLKKYGLSILRR